VQPVLHDDRLLVFLSKLAHVSSEGLPYTVFAFAGLIPWLFFANGVGAASDVLVANIEPHLQGLFSPPDHAGGLGALVAPRRRHFFGVLIGVMALYGLAPSATVLALPVFVLLALVAALAVASALGPERRLSGHPLRGPFFIQVGLFLTPVTYPASLIHSPKLRLLFALNPMAGAVEGFRGPCLAGRLPWLPALESLLVAGALADRGPPVLPACGTVLRRCHLSRWCPPRS